MSKPAARHNDMHICPLFNGNTPHVGGTIISSAKSVMINGFPAANVGDTCLCTGSVDSIIVGSGTVLIDGIPAARMGDTTAHGGTIVIGSTNVLIG